jgi:hypothetical protein
MADTHYYVVGDHDAWMVNCEVSELAQYASREAAANFAIDAALRLCKQGECAHVCVMDDDGRLRPKWPFCGLQTAHFSALSESITPTNRATQV